MSNFGAGAQQTGDIPRDYQPIASNFEAPAHSHLNKDQAAEIIRIAEGSHSHEGGDRGYSTMGGAGGIGSGLTGSSNSSSTGQSGLTGSGSAGQHLQQARDSLVGGGTGSVTQSHTGQSGNYELGQGDLSHNRTSLTGGDSTSHGSHAGLGAGAAGLGAGGLAATAANQGLGNRDQLSSTTGSSADAYGSSSTGAHSSTRLGDNTSSTAHSSTKNTSANSGSGPTASHGTLENKLQAELERNAAKKGTHAAGFGTAGMSSDSGNLHSERTGISSTSGGGPASGGHGQSGVTGMGGYGTGATAVGTGAGAGMAGLSGQHPQTSSIPLGGSNAGYGQQTTTGAGQGMTGRLAHEVENRAHGATGSDNVTGLGASGVNASHTHGSGASGLGSNLGSSTGRAL